MAVLQGGIFSRPRGKTGGIVFGAARTRQGKLVTSRLLVPPSNPNTAGQQQQRTKFSDCLSVVRRLGASIYQSDFNRSVGQLPGFQSMESIYLNQMDGSFDLSLVNEVNLGILHFPDTFAGAIIADTTLQCTWTDELGSNGTVADKVKILVVGKGTTERAGLLGVTKSITAVRSDTTVNITLDTGVGEVAVYAYMEGAGTAAGLLSVAYPYNMNNF